MFCPEALLRRGGGLFGALLCAWVLGGGMTAAWAWPVDQRVVVEAGREKFIKLSALDWFVVENPKVAQAERLVESGELLLTGIAAGRTQLLLAAEGKIAVWSLTVEPTSKGREPQVASAREPAKGGAELETARRLCPTLEASADGLRVTVVNEPCRRALRSLFQQPEGHLARDLSLTFEIPALQAQLGDIEAGFREAGLKGISARYVGAGLVLEGNLPAAQHVKALWVVFDRSVGRVALDDRIVRIEPADAGEERP